jgi:hypothetical protein
MFVLALAGGPSFPPADGWHTAQTGPTVPPQAPAAVTATVELHEPPGDNPRTAVASLGTDDVLIDVVDYGVGRLDYPPRRLPLRVDDGVAQHNWEGGQGLRYVIDAKVHGRLVEAIVYFGAAPTAATRRLADSRLAQLGS